MYGQLYGGGSEDELGPGIFTLGKDWLRDLVRDSK